MAAQHLERDWILRISRHETQRAVYPAELFAGVESVLFRRLGFQRPGLLLLRDRGGLEQHSER